MNRLRNLIHEIHRRSVWQVLGVYLVGSWGAIQVVDFITETAGLPDWAPGMALVLLVIGLPICLATAFVQEGMPGHEAEGGPAGGADSAATDTDASAAEAEPAAVNLAEGTGSLDRPTTRPSARKRLFTWRNAILGGVGAFALLGFTLIAYFVMWTTGIGPVGNLVAQGVIEERDPVVLAEFENRTGDEDLGTVVTGALRVDLLESQVVTLVDERLVADALRRMDRSPQDRLTAEVARELAAREGYAAVIEGEVSQVGTGYLLAARIVSPNGGTTLAAFRETVEGDSDLLAAIDRISQDLREKAGESLRDIRAGEALEAVTTSSLEALRLYTRSRELSDADAVGLLEQAVALDSTFAMAWRGLSLALANQDRDRERAVEAAEAAYRHRGRLSPRERLLTEAMYHDQVTGDIAAQAAAYRTVLETHPDDASALNNLGNTYAADGNWAEAAPYYERAINGPGRSNTAFNNLVIVLYNLGRKAEALEVHTEWESLYPVEIRMYSRKARVQWGMGDVDGAIATLRGALATLGDDPFAELTARYELGRILEARGQLGETRSLHLERRAISRNIGAGVPAFFADLDLAYLDGYTARTPQDSVALARRVEAAFEGSMTDVPELNRPYQVVGYAWLYLGSDPARAEEWFERDEARLPEELRATPGRRRTVLYQQAALASFSGDHETALEQLREIRRSQAECEACALLNFGHTFEAAGQADSAVVYFERYLAVDLFDDLDDQATAKGNILPRLGRLYQELGQTQEAADAFERFAEHWKDADPVLQPRVEAARAEAARLRSAGGGAP